MSEKSSEKDPAFLFYSKDWLEGTSEMTSEEKGVYIDLLASQHQRGSLPTNTKRLCKLARLGEDEFLKIWPEISDKFKLNVDGRLINRKLTKVVTERLEKGHKNRIISALAVAVRQSKMPYEVKFEAKKGFNVLDFIDIPEPKITESVTEWFNLRLKSIEDANENEDANEINNTIVNNIDGNEKKIENEGEPEFPVIKKKKNFPVAAEFSELPETEFYTAILGVKNSQGITLPEERVVDFWENFKGTNLRGQVFYQNKEDVYAHFQRWIKLQKIHNGTGNNGQKSKLGNKSGGFAILTEALNKNG